MSKPEYTEENREKLADQIVESWDLDTLLDYARGNLVEYYERDEDTFYIDWFTEFPEEKE